MNNLLAVHNLQKAFASEPAVRDISFSVGSGEAFCLLGANGAGKTTTMNMLLGFLQPDRGSAKFAGHDLWHERELARGQLMYLPENVSLYPAFSARENIEYLSALAKLKLSTQQIVDALLAAGLGPAGINKPTSGYSKGMRQKVAIAFAALKQAKLLLLDEPTSGLDPKATKEFTHLIQQEKSRGAVVVMITHDLQCAHLLADRIGIMQQGELMDTIDNSDCTLDELEQRYFASV